MSTVSAPYLILYIAVLDEVPDHIVPTLVAHSILNADSLFSEDDIYQRWKSGSFRKCVLRVNQKEFDKIRNLGKVHLGYENKTLGGEFSCVIPLPVRSDQKPNVLKFAKLWAPIASPEQV